MNLPKSAIPLLAVVFFSCASPPAPADHLANQKKIDTGKSQWGEYKGEIQVALLEDGRMIRLLDNVYYTGPDNKNWIAPKGSTVDGASIPHVFWSVIGGPLEGKYRSASVFHDVACVKKNTRWQDAAMMFYTAMRCSGVSPQKAKVMYTAVYRFGPHWPEPKKGVGALLNETSNFNQDLLPSEPLGETLSAAPTEADVNAIKSWVENEDPELDKLRTKPIPAEYKKKE